MGQRIGQVVGIKLKFNYVKIVKTFYYFFLLWYTHNRLESRIGDLNEV